MPNTLTGASTPHHRPRRNLAAKSFWKKTWPALKDQGWDYDGKRFFYPPDGYKEYAQKQNRSGSDVKEFFDGIAEVGEYVRQNPGINFVREEAGVKPANAKSPGGATEEEHKTASNEDAKSIAKGQDSKLPAARNKAGEAMVLRTPCSSPKEEPNGPVPKTEFRLAAASGPEPAPSTVKKDRKKATIKLRRVKPPRRMHSQSLDSGPKRYICDRCGRDNFINGHALGGHKKYCSKPEYDEARARANNRAQRSVDGRHKRKRSSSFPAEGSSHNGDLTSNSISRTSSSSSSGFNLQGITNSIRDFADRVDDLDEIELDEALNTSDLFELQVIQTVLREERARLTGRLAGLEAGEPHEPIPLADIFDDVPDLEEQKSAEVDDEYETELVGTELAMSLGF